MFGYGIKLERAQEIFPYTREMHDFLMVGQLSIHNMYGDCGTILLTGCNRAEEDEIQAMMQIASEAGMSKIFGTIVHYNHEIAIKQKNKFVKAGFRVIKKGASNRTPKKMDITIFYHNPNPIKKGY
jgi:hypothetical protein